MRVRLLVCGYSLVVKRNPSKIDSSVRFRLPVFMFKRCCRCKESLPLDRFKSRAKSKDGLQGQCIDCQKIYRRLHYVKNRKKYIAKARVWDKKFVKWYKEYKSKFSCVQCGENHPACIHFHHHNNDKDKEVAVFAQKSSKKGVIKEIAKCTPLCANCHAKLHWKEP